MFAGWVMLHSVAPDPYASKHFAIQACPQWTDFSLTFKFIAEKWLLLVSPLAVFSSYIQSVAVLLYQWSWESDSLMFVVYEAGPNGK